MSADIFISFASQDAKTATTICTALETRGFKCWVSTRDIPPGENFQSAIVRAIRSAKVLLLVFTANSNRSDEMTKELALASQQKLMVVPLRMENITPGDAFAYEFATRQWIDLFADWEQAMNHLCTRLTAALDDDRTHVDTIVLGKPSLRGFAKTRALVLKRPSRFVLLGMAAGAIALAALVALSLPRQSDKPSVGIASAEAAAPAPAPAPQPVIVPEAPAQVLPAAPLAATPLAATPTIAAPAPISAAAPDAPPAAELPPAPKAPRPVARKASSNLPY